MGNNFEKAIGQLEFQQRGNLGSVVDFTHFKIGNAAGANVPPRLLSLLQKTTALDLSGTQLTALPSALGTLTALETLTIENNKLESIPDEIGSLVGLTELNAYGCKLTALPDPICRLQGLKKLAVHKNALVRLPDNIGNMTSLEVLFIGGNKLTVLPGSIWGCIALEELHAQCNQLSDLEGIGQLQRLRVLNIRANKLAVLDLSIGNCTDLVELELQDNKLSILPESVGRCVALTTLNLKGNKLTELPYSIGYLRELHELDLTDCPLKEPFKVLKGFPARVVVASLAPYINAMETHRNGGKSAAATPAPQPLSINEAIQQAEVQDANMRKLRAPTITVARHRGIGYNALQSCVAALLWIQKVLGDVRIGPNGLSLTKDLWRPSYLVDGVVLCALMEKIQPGLIVRVFYGLGTAGGWNTDSGRRVSRKHASSNVRSFGMACLQYGLKPEQIFRPDELLRGMNLVAVFDTLNHLGELANSRGFLPVLDKLRPQYVFKTEQVALCVAILRAREVSAQASVAIDALDDSDDTDEGTAMSPPGTERRHVTLNRRQTLARARGATRRQSAALSAALEKAPPLQGDLPPPPADDAPLAPHLNFASSTWIGTPPDIPLEMHQRKLTEENVQRKLTEENVRKVPQNPRSNDNRTDTVDTVKLDIMVDSMTSIPGNTTSFPPQAKATPAASSPLSPAPGANGSPAAANGSPATAAKPKTAADRFADNSRMSVRTNTAPVGKVPPKRPPRTTKPGQVTFKAPGDATPDFVGSPPPVSAVPAAAAAAAVPAAKPAGKAEPAASLAAKPAAAANPAVAAAKEDPGKATTWDDSPKMAARRSTIASQGHSSEFGPNSVRRAALPKRDRALSKSKNSAVVVNGSPPPPETTGSIIHRSTIRGDPKMLTSGGDSSMSDVIRTRLATSTRNTMRRAARKEWLEESWNIDEADVNMGRELGAGSFGTVNKANYLGVDVAVKRLEFSGEEEMKKALQYLADRELAILKRLKHPNVLQFIGTYRHDNALYLVTEFVMCGSVWGLLLEHGRNLDMKVILKIAGETAAGLGYLHKASIIHRDVKAENLLLAENFRVKVADFGFARLVEARDEDNSNARRMTYCGTGDYMAPELLNKERYDRSVDVFAFGFTILELLTGSDGNEPSLKRFPDNDFRLQYDEIKRTIRPETPPAFVDLIMECVAHEAALRPSFDALVTSIEEIELALIAPLPADTMDEVILTLVEEACQDIFAGDDVVTGAVIRTRTATRRGTNQMKQAAARAAASKANASRVSNISEIHSEIDLSSRRGGESGMSMNTTGTRAHNVEPWAQAANIIAELTGNPMDARVSSSNVPTDSTISPDNSDDEDDDFILGLASAGVGGAAPVWQSNQGEMDNLCHQVDDLLDGFFTDSTRSTRSGSTR